MKSAAASALADRAALYGVRRTRAAVTQDDGHESSAWANRYFPLTLAALGAVMWVVQIAFRPLANSVAAGAMLSVIMLVVGLVVTTCGVMLASKVMDADFGDLGAAILKLAAAATFGGACFALAASLDLHSARGPIVGWHVAILVYFAAFKTMFDLDLTEALMTSAIVGVMLAIASLVIFQVRP